DHLAGTELIVIDDADHSFNVPKASATTTTEVLAGLATTTASWIDRTCLALADADPTEDI
ncbi:MAG: hypothetical protein M3349_05245, partial [Actinomycetota bacterium]|nr:hypothetical protein [Actinomycetota bacterium]